MAKLLYIEMDMKLILKVLLECEYSVRKTKCSFFLLNSMILTRLNSKMNITLLFNIKKMVNLPGFTLSKKFGKFPRF